MKKLTRVRKAGQAQSNDAPAKTSRSGRVACPRSSFRSSPNRRPVECHELVYFSKAGGGKPPFLTLRYGRYAQNLSSSLGAITGPGANSDVFARGFDLNLSISTVVFPISRVVTKQVLRAQLSGDGGECLR